MNDLRIIKENVGTSKFQKFRKIFDHRATWAFDAFAEGMPEPKVHHRCVEYEPARTRLEQDCRELAKIIPSVLESQAAHPTSKRFTAAATQWMQTVAILYGCTHKDTFDHSTHTIALPLEITMRQDGTYPPIQTQDVPAANVTRTAQKRKAPEGEPAAPAAADKRAKTVAAPTTVRIANLEELTNNLKKLLHDAREIRSEQMRIHSEVNTLFLQHRQLLRGQAMILAGIGTDDTCVDAAVRLAPEASKWVRRAAMTVHEVPALTEAARLALAARRSHPNAL